MKVTIKDIANKLNLNFSSVSRALNNKPGVSEKTRKLVEKTAKEMDYHPNVIARGLVSNVTKTIGVIMPDIINPLFGEITTAIIETANQSDYDVFLCITNWSKKKEEDYIYTIQQKQVDGLIIKSVSSAHSKLLENASVPVVGYESWATNNEFTSISTDNEKGGYIAAEYLLECGYSKTVILSGPANSSASVNRRRGFLKAYTERNIDFDESKIYTGEYNIENGYSSAKTIFREHPDTDSIFTGNDVMAFGILHYLEENNLKPGEDIGVIGFDNIQMSRLPQIRLTTVKQPKHSIGRIMTKALLEEINNHHKGIQNYPQRILLEPELIIRNTTCAR
jgi:LacI family transcriptional regulator